MSRPQTDIDAGRNLLLGTVEKIVRARGAADISMTELAAEAGMSPSNIYRFFDSKEALLEAVAEQWFADKIKVMEDVTAADMAAQLKMHAFFGRRFQLMLSRYQDDPELFKSYCQLGHQHFEVVRGYVDLGDHYLAIIVAESMDEGYFPNLSIDETVSIINQMVQPYCNPDLLPNMGHLLSVEKLTIIIDTIFVGLSKHGDACLHPSGIRAIS